MYNKTIINPDTGRNNKVRCWDLSARGIFDTLKANGNSARNLGWAILSDDESLKAMEATQHGDSAASNFALNVFENALDFGLGIAAVNVLRVYKEARGKYPKQFTLACNSKGDIFCLWGDQVCKVG